MCLLGLWMCKPERDLDRDGARGVDRLANEIKSCGCACAIPLMWAADLVSKNSHYWLCSLRVRALYRRGLLRSGSLCLVRRLHSYYGLVRLPMPVHHRLRLLAFPMRTAVRESELSTDGQT